jgi:hypothetical protein
MVTVGVPVSSITWKGCVVVLPARSVAVMARVALKVSLESKA